MQNSGDYFRDMGYTKDKPGDEPFEPYQGEP
jgi:hypothetical protein